MSRELRQVHENWEHPKNANGRYIPLFKGSDYRDALDEWEKQSALWNAGVFPDYTSEESRKLTYSEYSGERPNQSDYMPCWTDAEKTHVQMYETTSEGTPISPVMPTIESLARWLTDNKASAFGDMTADYDSWLATCKLGYSVGAFVGPTGFHSGVELNNMNLI